MKVYIVNRCILNYVKLDAKEFNRPYKVTYNRNEISSMTVEVNGEYLVYIPDKDMSTKDMGKNLEAYSLIPLKSQNKK